MPLPHILEATPAQEAPNEPRRSAALFNKTLVASDALSDFHPLLSPCHSSPFGPIDAFPASMIGPAANSAHEGELPKLRSLAATLNLCGLANDTKWNALLTAMRSKSVWVPSFRYRCIDSDFVSSWDGEWWHHVPMPMISVAWMELRHSEYDYRLPPRRIDHSRELCELLDEIGFDYAVGEHAIRIFGYSPRDTTPIPP
jgi:hypothetical protein